jgi:pimeloyl-[acyl-carrier protein] synthase
MPSPTSSTGSDALSLFQLMDPEVLANPYPLYHRLRSTDSVHWDPYLNAWVCTRYEDVVRVLTEFSANTTPSPEALTAVGLAALNPIAEVMIKQMLFMDAPMHTRLRVLAAGAFAPARVTALRTHIQEICDSLLDKVLPSGQLEVIRDLAAPMPAIVMAEMLGVPTSDHEQLKAWSADFAEMLGNFQGNPDRALRIVRSVEAMEDYFRCTIQELRKRPHEGLINSLVMAEVDGDRFTEDEVIANTILTMVGGQETTTNLIANGLLTLMRNPGERERLRTDASLLPAAVEELLRYESPSQYTARLAPEPIVLGGKQIKKRQGLVAVMGAANRDPERFEDPDRLDLSRPDNRHVAFGWGPHFCFGAALARIEGQVAFGTILRRLGNIGLDQQELTWRTNLGLRGLTELHVSFDAGASSRQAA